MKPLDSFGLIFGTALAIDLLFYTVAGIALLRVYRKRRRHR